MKKKTPLPAKITVGVATTGIIMMGLGVIRENGTAVFAGLALTFIGFFASFVVSTIMGIKKTYPSRGDPYQKKMRTFRYIRLIAGGIPFLGMGIVMYGIYNADKGAKPLMNLGLMLITVGIVAVIVISVIMAAASRSAEPQYGSKSAVPSSNTAAAPYSSDPVISHILANPYVLLDERIRQIHEVQNLLQYPEIQRIFFEPEKLHSLFTQERVGELLNVVRDWITRNNAEEIFAAAEMRRLVNSGSRTNKTAQANRPDKSTMIGVILTVIIWLVLFVAAASAVLRHL